MDIEFNLFRQLFYAAYLKRFKRSFGRFRDFFLIIWKIGSSNGSVVVSWIKNFLLTFLFDLLQKIDFVLITS